MNARPMPRSSAPQMDVTALEWEIPTLAAIAAATQFLARHAVIADDVRLFEGGPHLRLARLQHAARTGHEVAWCGAGLDGPDARRAALYGGIARTVHADPGAIAVTSCTVENVFPTLGRHGAFPDLLSVLAEQKHRQMATVQFRQVSGNEAMPVPLALVNPHYVREVENGRPHPRAMDDFDYATLRHYSSDAGVAAGATCDEALAQGLLAAKEQHACGNFVAKGIGLRQAPYLCRVSEPTLTPQIAELLEVVSARMALTIHLLDIAGEGQTPTYLAYADSPDTCRRMVAAGAGFSGEHAATRALRALLQRYEYTRYLAGQSSVERQVRLHDGFQGFLEEQEGQYRSFAFHHVHALLAEGKFVDVPLERRRLPVRATLYARIRGLCEAFSAEGLTPWYTQYEPKDSSGGLHCVQVILAPFNAGFLLLHGVPVGISLASLEGVAND